MHSLCYCLNETIIDGESDALRHLCTRAYKEVFPILLVTAIVTNAFNSFVLLYLHRVSIKTSSRLYLLWLAITHTLACGPLLISRFVRDSANLSYGWAYYMAHIEQQLYNSLNCTSIYITLALALDRYSAVCDAYFYSGSQRLTHVSKRVVIAYVVSFSIYFANGFAQEPKKMINNSNGWYVGDSWVFDKYLWKIWAIIVQIIHRFLPGIFLFVINTRIFSTVSKLQKRITSGNTSCSSNRNNREKQLCFLMLSFTIIFVITNVPSAILEIMYITHSEHCHLEWMEELSRTVANYLEMSGFCFDFFLHFLVNRDYRRGIHKMSTTFCKYCSICNHCVVHEDSITEL